MFDVGQVVECINDAHGGGKYGCGYNFGLRNGAIYHVSRTYSGGELCNLVEVRGGWYCDRFRVVERKTSIAVFKEILRRETINDPLSAWDDR